MTENIEIKVPDIGADEVEVTEILVNIGDVIAIDDPVIMVEGDKASMEVPAESAGKVCVIHVKVGDKVSQGIPMMTLTTENAIATHKLTDAPVSAPSLQSAIPTKADSVTSIQPSTRQQETAIFLPDVGADEVVVNEIFVKLGNQITQEDPIICVEGDKASMEVPSPLSGEIKAIHVAQGDTVKQGSLILTIEEKNLVPVATVTTASPLPPTANINAAAQTAVEPAPLVAAATPTNSGSNQRYSPHASPYMRRLAREFGINITAINGTGRKGRLTKADLINYVKSAVQKDKNINGASGGAAFDMLPWPKVDFAKFGEIEESALTPIQKISGKNLSRNWIVIPHVTQFDEADITELETWRKQLNIEAEKAARGKGNVIKITPIIFILKAVAKALEKFPTLNSSLSPCGEKLILKKYIHIGIAVDTPNGLFVPVIRDVNQKSINTLSSELSEISLKARAGKLKGSDMQGGCFTLSSLGGIGGTGFTPIVNAPEVAILGISKAAIKPVWSEKDHTFKPRLMLPFSLSFDHRAIDGAAGAYFLSFICQLMTDMRRVIL